MSYTLLLADDSATVQRIVELTFASEDISVVAFGDGDHAIASLDRSIPDIVLADVGMPGRNGYEVARYIKNSPALAHIPVLLLTGAFEPVDQTKAVEAGCDGVLIKPFEPQFVIGRVKELLQRPRPGAKEAEVEQYFEQLDQAFAKLATAPPPAEAVLEIPPAVAAIPDPERSLDQKTASSTDGAIEAAPPMRPSLADAFAALLAAERSATASKGPTPTLVSSSRSVPNDDVIERVTRRVLEQLSDRVIRDTVAGIVHETAERLVREEIERIKSNIK
jgi:CheY-like chemotaxis protein